MQNVAKLTGLMSGPESLLLRFTMKFRGPKSDKQEPDIVPEKDPPNVESDQEALERLKVPKDLPSVVDIKKALPAHCFESHLASSLYYMLKDFVLVAVLYFLAEWTWIALPLSVQLVITPLYWLLQGTMFTALFVVGHDAGHGSFSRHSPINDLCGNICHAFLFCPYFMWRLSHRNHHKNTGNIDKEEVFYPVRERDPNRFPSILPGFGLGIGWFYYLLQGYKPRGVDHFNPLHPMFRNHVMDCVISLAFLFGWSTCLGHYWNHFGMAYLLYHWVAPVLVFGSFIVIITFLHHHDSEVPWYSDHLWSYVRGQLSSVDRDYGWCHHLIHHIGTHQIHHLFPVIPHYHLEEATASFRRAFPHLVRASNDPILPAFCRMFKKYVEQSLINTYTKIHCYK